MPTEFNDPNDKFNVVEVEVFQDDSELEGQLIDDSRYNSEAEVRIPQNYEEDTQSQATYTRRRRPKHQAEKKYRKNKYGWAFFLCSLFIGVGLTATFEHILGPLPLFLGLGFGFLFFVDPLYDKVMDKIENL